MESWNVKIDKTNSKTSTKYTQEVENCDPICFDVMKQYVSKSIQFNWDQNINIQKNR